MLLTILFVLAHFLLCTLFFMVVQRPLFMLYNHSVNKTAMRPGELKEIFLLGCRTDQIAAAYLTAVPLVPMLLLSLIPGVNIRLCVLVIDAFISVAVSLAVVSDTALYRFWQFKLEASVLTYLKNPKAAFASVSYLYIVAAVAALAVVACAFFAFMWLASLVLVDFHQPGLHNWGWHLGYILLIPIIAALLFMNIRGLKIRPNNPSLAYFSPNQYVNHCTLNPLYSFIYSLSVKDSYKHDFRFFKSDECRKEAEKLFKKTDTPPEKLLNTTRPNILLVVWESLSARYISTLSGESGVMPNVERLSEEGILFTRCDASSFRTERGLVCVLCGTPGQPSDNVVKHSAKLAKLPGLPRELRRVGYDTTAVHGGNCVIMRKSDIYLTSGHTTLVQQKDLPPMKHLTRWGIHDGDMFDWLYDDIRHKTDQKKQWFTTLQTLSSHEPFDVPFHKFDDIKKNAFAYVDDCFGRFIDELKASPAWDNLLVIVTGDHGFNYREPLVRESFPHICMMMIGGAVKKPLKFDKIMCQTDLAATLLGQLGLNHDMFPFSRDVFSPDYTYPFSFHTYNNGFLFRDDTGATNYDNNARRAVSGADEERERKGKIILQSLYEYLNKL